LKFNRTGINIQELYAIGAAHFNKTVLMAGVLTVLKPPLIFEFDYQDQNIYVIPLYISMKFLCLSQGSRHSICFFVAPQCTQPNKYVESNILIMPLLLVLLSFEALSLDPISKRSILANLSVGLKL